MSEKRERRSTDWSTLAVPDLVSAVAEADRLLIARLMRSVIAIDRQKRSIVWRHPLPTPAGEHCLLVHDEIALVVVREVQGDFFLTALSTVDGSVRWRRPLRYVPDRHSFSIFEGVVACLDIEEGRARAVELLSADSGEEVGRRPISQRSSGICSAGDALWAWGADGVSRLDGDTFVEVWGRRRFRGISCFDDRLLGWTSSDDGARALMAIGRSAPEDLSIATDPNWTTHSSVLVVSSRGRLLVADENGQLSALALPSLSPLWSHRRLGDAFLLRAAERGDQIIGIVAQGYSTTRAVSIDWKTGEIGTPALMPPHPPSRLWSLGESTVYYADSRLMWPTCASR